MSFYVRFFLLLEIFMSTFLYANTYNYNKEYEENIKNNSKPLTVEEQNLVRDDIVKWASLYLEKGYKYKEKVTLTNELKKEEKRFIFDCSGFIAAVFWSADISIFEKQASLSQTGTTTIYNTLKRFNKIYKSTPSKGDVIFFNRTTKAEKPLSHVGLVVDVNENGTVTFIHAGSRGLTKGYINLNYPDLYRTNNVIFNSYIRAHVGDKGLTSKCFDSFGTIF